MRKSRLLLRSALSLSHTHAISELWLAQRISDFAHPLLRPMWRLRGPSKLGKKRHMAYGTLIAEINTGPKDVPDLASGMILCRGQGPPCGNNT